MIKYVIPARKGSKGLIDKNVKLFDYTISTIPENEYKNVWITTNDNRIISKSQKFNVHKRSENLCSDNANIKDVLIDLSSNFNKEDIIVMLYLTYPERTWLDIQKALLFWNDNGQTSLLCRKEVKSNPYLCMYENGLNGEQVIKHNLYRRQDYKKCFELCHYIFISRVDEIKNLNNNLYNENTIFMKIDDKIDIDTEKDYKKFLEVY